MAVVILLNLNIEFYVNNYIFKGSFSQTTPEDISKMFFFCDSKKLCCCLLLFENFQCLHLLSETELYHHQYTFQNTNRSLHLCSLNSL